MLTVEVDEKNFIEGEKSKCKTKASMFMIFNFIFFCIENYVFTRKKKQLEKR